MICSFQIQLCDFSVALPHNTLYKVSRLFELVSTAPCLQASNPWSCKPLKLMGSIMANAD